MSLEQLNADAVMAAAILAKAREGNQAARALCRDAEMSKAETRSVFQAALRGAARDSHVAICGICGAVYSLPHGRCWA